MRLLAVLFTFIRFVNGQQPSTFELSAQVLDAETHQPLSETTVSVQTGQRVVSVTTGAAGTYRILNVPGDSLYVIGYTHAGYLQMAASHPVSRDATIYMTKEAVLEGTITTTTGVGTGRWSEPFAASLSRDAGNR